MFKAFLLTGISFFVLSTAIAGNIPECIGNNQPLPIDNEQVLHWKQTTKNQYKDRGHIEGILTRVYQDKTGHRHLQVQIGNGPRDTVEVIYNQAFGKIPNQALQVGVTLEACGDYITANRKGGGYQPSPDGAIIHWVHKAVNTRHESGYVAIEGQLYGYEENGH